ncbi:MAG: hydroxymethylbilane synthase [Synergistaceae bacterium]|nr:hydroxymethylbilane synthase [Synergistaceae bacterium]
MLKLRIGTRGSQLALIQTKIIADEILKAYPDAKISIVKITTSGDRNSAPFSSDPQGIKGMFTLELEQALMNREIDFAVHSLKDLPANISPELPIVAYSRRADPRDALVGSEKVIGSSSLRRRLQLKRLFPESDIIPVRGNINTRLQKMDSGEFSGLVLAVAGLERLGQSHRITRIFSVGEVMPSPGQGILACQGRAYEDYGYLSCVNDEDAELCAVAERSFACILGAGCNVPVGAYAEILGDSMRIRGLFVNEAGKFLRGDVLGRKTEAEELGKRLAEEIVQ